MTKYKDWIIGAGVALALVMAMVGIGGNNQSALESKVDALAAQISSFAGILDNQVLGGTTRFPKSDVSALSFTSENGFAQGTYFGNSTLADGFTDNMLEIDLNATTSAGTLNPEGATIWVYDAYVRQQTASSTAGGSGYVIGTSSTGVIAADGTCGAGDTCGAGNGGMASILKTGAIATQAVGNMYFKADFQGTDTRDGSGTRFVVPVASTDYITCHASSTPAANNTSGGQAVQCVVRYLELAD